VPGTAQFADQLADLLGSDDLTQVIAAQITWVRSSLGSSRRASSNAIHDERPGSGAAATE